MKKQLDQQNKNQEEEHKSGANWKRGKATNLSSSKKQNVRADKLKQINDIMSKASISELTVYRNAIKCQLSKSNLASSSSEEEIKMVDTSKEIVDSDETADMKNDSNSMIKNFIVDSCERIECEERRRYDEVSGNENRRRSSNEPSTSRRADNREEEHQLDAWANDIIRNAEIGKARMYDLPGRFGDLDLIHQNFRMPEINIENKFFHSSMVDETYQLIGSHIDLNTQEKIVRGEYVYFSRLIPKDNVLTVDDNRYEMVIRDGKTYWIPASSHESRAISGFNRWEQAFRVFSDIYMKAHPQRASELVQYCHLIHTAAQTFTWENVYMYDKDFRLHMSKHPKRSWSIILQQAWSVRLKDKIRAGSSSSHGQWRHEHKKELCKRFNRGECTAGSECRYEHRC